MKHVEQSSDSANKSSQATTDLTAENIKESIAKFQLWSSLEALLLRKKFLENGDSPDTHAQKVHKLKILTESLHSSASKAEKRILEHRMQKEEALSFRVNKTCEVSQLEKDLEAELRSLEDRKIEIEAELKKVTTSLTLTKARLRNAREEREQFDQASNQILEHFNTKEDELSRSVASFRAEASACTAFIAFMEATWGFHSSYTEKKEKQVSDELKKLEEYFGNLAIQFLSAYKDELGPALSNIRKLADDIKGSEKATGKDSGSPLARKGRRLMEGEYLESEEKIMTMFDVVESIKKYFITQNVQDPSIVIKKGDDRFHELCDSLVKMKREYETMERPMLEIERPQTPRTQLSRKTSSPRRQSPRDKFAKPTRLGKSLSLKLLTGASETKSPDALTKFSMALEEDSREGSMDDIDWEFDEPVPPADLSTELVELVPPADLSAEPAEPHIN